MDAKIRKTYTDFDGGSIEEPTEGQIVYCPESKSTYIYKDGKYEPMSIGLNMNMYDINKQVISQLPNLNEDKIKEEKQTITDFMKTTDNTYYMLLCKEHNYYTVFNVVELIITETSTFADEVINCAQDLGTIKSIEIVEGAIEIWVQPEEENSESAAMYLFPYDGGVIICQK